MILQLIKFGLVGGTATAIHSGLFLSLIYINVSPLLSNAYAFSIAFLFSFLTQSRWTFGVEERELRHLVKFSLTACCGFALNSLIVFIVMVHYQFSAYYAISAMICITTIFTFLLNKFWVYN